MRPGGTFNTTVFQNDINEIQSGQPPAQQLIQLPLTASFNGSGAATPYGGRPDLQTPSKRNPIAGAVQATRIQLQQPCNSIQLLWHALTATGDYVCSYPLNSPANVGSSGWPITLPGTGATGASTPVLGASAGFAAQSIPGATATYLTLTAPSRDDAGFFNPAQPDRLTIPSGKAGWYVVSTVINWNNTAPAVTRIQVNGAYATGQGQPGAAYDQSASISLYLHAGDYLQVQVYGPAFTLAATPNSFTITGEASGGSLATTADPAPRAISQAWAFGWMRLNGIGPWFPMSLLPSNGTSAGYLGLYPFGGFSSINAPMSFVDWIGYWDGSGDPTQGPVGANLYLIALASANVSLSSAGASLGQVNNYATPSGSGPEAQGSNYDSMRSQDTLVKAGRNGR